MRSAGREAAPAAGAVGGAGHRPTRTRPIFEFAERRLGREAAETFVDTAVAGISAGDSRALSVRSQFPILKEWEQQHGSLLKAMLARQKTARPARGLLSFDRGLGTLTTMLASQLERERARAVDDRAG